MLTVSNYRTFQIAKGVPIHEHFVHQPSHDLWITITLVHNNFGQNPTKNSYLGIRSMLDMKCDVLSPSTVWSLWYELQASVVDHHHLCDSFQWENRHNHQRKLKAMYINCKWCDIASEVLDMRLCIPVNTYLHLVWGACYQMYGEDEWPLQDALMRIFRFYMLSPHKAILST